MAWICRLYKAVCRVCGPRKLTISAWLWVREQEGMGCFWREMVDDWFLVWRGQTDHCRCSYERESKRPCEGRLSL